MKIGASVGGVWEAHGRCSVERQFGGKWEANGRTLCMMVYNKNKAHDPGTAVLVSVMLPGSVGR